MSTFSTRGTRRPAGAPLAAAVLTLLALAATGCWEGPGPDAIRRAVELQVPEARYDREVHLRLGRMTTGLVRFVANRALDPEADAEARTMVNSIRRLEVAVYANRSDLPDSYFDGLEMPRKLRRMLAREGWLVMSEVRDAGSAAWVLIDQEDDPRGAIRGLYVVALEPAELAVVRLEGRFDEAFAKLFADDPHGAKDRALDDTHDV